MAHRHSKFPRVKNQQKYGEAMQESRRKLLYNAGDTCAPHHPTPPVQDIGPFAVFALFDVWRVPMKCALLGAALAALCLPLTTAPSPVHADDDSITYGNTNYAPSSDDSTAGDSSYPYQGRARFTVDGLVRRVDADHDRLVIYGDDNRRYTVDDYDAAIVLRDADRAGDTADLRRGMRIHIIGTLLSRTLITADRIRVLSTRAAQDAPQDAALVAPVPDTLVAPPAPGPSPDVVPAVPAPAGKDVSLEALITDVDTDGGRVTILGPDDKRLTADTHGSDIILLSTEHAGGVADLKRGMHVRLIGVQAPDGSMQADRIRVLPDDPAPADAPLPAVLVDIPTAVLPPVPVDAELDHYTGILIDARDLHAIQRSPAPTIIGPGPSPLLLYPDRTHVPTPDEVQEESIVRYYRTVDAATDGVAGPHPLILHAVAVVGSDDGLQLTAEDAALFQALDQRLHFTRTWKVGFLIPQDR